jgi:hypothetical protein
VHRARPCHIEEYLQVAKSFDPYREALVLEKVTVWPPELAHIPASQRPALEERLHADAGSCSQLEYIRVHTGFCRRITVTEEDVARCSPIQTR